MRYDDTMKIVRDVAAEADREKPKAIFVDIIGVGGGVHDRLKQLGYPVIAVNSAETDQDLHAILVHGIGLEAALRRADLTRVDRLVAWRHEAASGQ